MAKVYYIPSGPKNIESLFPTVNFNDVDNYYIGIYEYCGGDIIGNTSPYKIAGECCQDKIRIHFLNYLGTIDAINFKIHAHDHEAKSEQIQTPTRYPLVKTDFSINRYDLRANDTLTLSNVHYRERDMEWIQELIDSPFALIEWTGTQGQVDSYIPVTILDTKFKKRKLEDRYEYEVLIEVKLSHEKFIIRN